MGTIADRRQFSNSVVNTDRFLRMDGDAKALYYYSVMHSDDEGLIDTMQGLLVALRIDETPLQTLLEQGYLLDLGDGVYAVTHWFIHLGVHRTVYLEKRNRLTVRDGLYCFKDGTGNKPAASA